jgi:tRNA dimethylallyltransferase
VRAAIDRDGERLGWAALHERLQRIDPAAAARIAPSDRQRIQRALEVHELTGRPITELQRSPTSRDGPRILVVALVPADRAALAERIAQRFDAMVAQGFVAEVEGLRARGDLTPLRSVGYRQIWAHLAGDYGWDEARTRAIVATRQYAKRQLTWLRRDTRCEAWPAFAPGVADRYLERLVREGLIGAENG